MLIVAYAEEKKTVIFFLYMSFRNEHSPITKTYHHPPL